MTDFSGWEMDFFLVRRFLRFLFGSLIIFCLKQPCQASEVSADSPDSEIKVPVEQCIRVSHWI